MTDTIEGTFTPPGTQSTDCVVRSDNQEAANLHDVQICSGDFNYAQYSLETQEKLRKAADAIRDHLVAIDQHSTKVVEYSIQIGRNLNKIKRAMKHGQFIPWVQHEFKESYRSVVNHMRVADLKEKYPDRDFTSLAKSVLLLLASKKVPEESRTEILDKAAAGEHVTTLDAKSVIAEHAAEPEPVKLRAVKRKGNRRSAAVAAERARIEEETLQRQEADDAVVRNYVKCLVSCLPTNAIEDGATLANGLHYPERAKAVLGDELLIELSKCAFDLAQKERSSIDADDSASGESAPDHGLTEPEHDPEATRH